MDRFTGGCLCGDVRLVASGRPYRVGLCHCLDCQRRSSFNLLSAENLLGSIYVTYAKQDEDREDDVAGRGLGMVNVFTASGALVRRIAKGGSPGRCSTMFRSCRAWSR